MNLFRRIFGGGTAPQSDGAIHLYVRCERCGTPVHVRVDPRNDLLGEYDDSNEASGYRLVKEIMDSRCFRLMRAEIAYDRARHELHRELEGGTFITQQEYETLLAEQQPKP